MIYVVFFAAMRYFVVLFEKVKISWLSVLHTIKECKNNMQKYKTGDSLPDLSDRIS